MTWLVTGANGFVGRAVVARLHDKGRPVRAAVRQPRGDDDEFVIGDLTAWVEWGPALRGVDTVIHLAARAHVMREAAADPDLAFRMVNERATLDLARACIVHGVRRLVYVSSVKVLGESGTFRHDAVGHPEDAYGRSKWAAEEGLRALAATAPLELVIVRPPLVYGPGVRANFRALLDAVSRGVPLPLGGAQNLRSLIGLDNLVDILVRCAEHPAAAGQAFLVSDGEDLSTAELVRRMARAVGRPPRLLNVPPAMLRVAAALVGRAGMTDRLFGTLQVDISTTRRLLDWSPPSTIDAELARVVAGSRA